MTELKLKVGDPVEDWRTKSVFKPNPKDRYRGENKGVVIEVDNDSFRVQWAALLGEPPYKMGYHWDFWEMGIRRPDQVPEEWKR